MPVGRPLASALQFEHGRLLMADREQRVGVFAENRVVNEHRGVALMKENAASRVLELNVNRAMIAMTTSSSMRVKACFDILIIFS